MAHCLEANRVKPRDRERWERLSREIAEFEWTLAELEAGRDPPPSPLTGVKSAALPDMIGQAAGGADAES
jgi:hypothetical protein